MTVDRWTLIICKPSKFTAWSISSDFFCKCLCRGHNAHPGAMRSASSSSLPFFLPEREEPAVIKTDSHNQISFGGSEEAAGAAVATAGGQSLIWMCLHGYQGCGVLELVRRGCINLRLYRLLKLVRLGFLVHKTKQQKSTSITSTP